MDIFIFSTRSKVKLTAAGCRGEELRHLLRSLKDDLERENPAFMAEHKGAIELWPDHYWEIAAKTLGSVIPGSEWSSKDQMGAVYRLRISGEIHRVYLSYYR